MGILQRLFGRDPNQPKESFFLEPDDAKTYGDIDYMRKPQVIKRTFAKTISGGGGETIQEISSVEKRVVIQPETKAKSRSSASTATAAWGGSTPIATPEPTAGSGEAVQEVTTVETRIVTQPEAAPAPQAATPPATEAPAPEASAAKAPAEAPAPAPDRKDDLDFLSMARGIKRR